MSVSIFVRPLNSYACAGWQAEGVGYYIHKGRVYLTGELRGGGELDLLFGTAGKALLSRLPHAIRPSTVKNVGPLVTQGLPEDPATPGVERPLEVPALILPSGVLELADLPSSTNEPALPGRTWGANPEAQSPFYEFGFISAFNLNNVSWELRAEADAFTPLSLAAYLGDFEDIDSGYAAHGSRIHLSGRVRARVDGATTILARIPAAAMPGELPGENRFHAGGMFGGTVVEALGHNFGAEFRENGGESTSLADNFKLDMGTDTKGHALDNHSEREGGVQPPGAIVTGEESVEYGTRSCHYAKKCGAKIQECTSTRHIASLPIPDLALNVDDALARFFPRPDLFAVRIAFTFSGKSGELRCPTAEMTCGTHFAPLCWPLEGGTIFAPQSPEEAPMPWGVAVGPPDAGFWAWTSSLESVTLSNLGKEEGSGWIVGAAPFRGTQQEPVTFNGLVKRGDGKGFNKQLFSVGGEGIPDPETLWVPGELNELISFAFSGFVAQQSLSWEITVLPYWFTRQIYLKAGDIVDLTGAGWQGSAGEMDIGASASARAPMSLAH